ncbi:MAG: TAXI family TRAP transporter solute-binding subunit [Pseudolabrys sp.]
MFHRLMLAAAAVCLAATAHAQNIGIAVSNPGSLYHSIGTAVAKVANEAGLATTIQPATAPTQYIPVVGSGDIEIGLCNMQELREALLGESFFSGRANPNLRMVGVLFPLRNGVWVRKDSPYKTVSDLKGKPVASGYTAQKTVYQVLKAVLATEGMTTSDIREVPVPSVVAAADALASGKVESFVFAVGAAKVREVDAAVGGLRSLPLTNNEKTLKAMREHFPAAYFFHQMPGPAAPGIHEPTWVLAYPAVVFASSKTPDEVVYKLTKILAENKEGMQKIFPPFGMFDAAKMYADAGPIQYHPGAVKFYKEKGLIK